MRERTIVYPHPPSQKTMPAWWTPRVTALALLVGVALFFGLVLVEGMFRGIQMEHSRTAVTETFNFLAAGHRVADMPKTWFTPRARAQALELERSLGPVRGWEYERTYGGLVGTFDRVEVLVHRTTGDDHEEVLVDTHWIIMAEWRTLRALR